MQPAPGLSGAAPRGYARGMHHSVLRHLRRCRLLFGLALCAWLALAGAAFAQSSVCCAEMADMAGATTAHHGSAPAPLHADCVPADCACAHTTAAALPELALPAGPLRFAVEAWPNGPLAAPELPHAPPLRPPLAC